MLRMLAVCSVLIVLLMCMSGVAAAAPTEIHHQGQLLDASDNPINGTVSMEFRVYDASTGGTLLWSESHPSVSVSDGLFNVLLGSSVALSADLFASPPSGGLPPVGERYLEVVVAGQAITPRVRLVSVPYASTAIRVDGDLQTGPGELLLDGSGGGGGGGGGTVGLQAHGTGGTFRVQSSGDQVISASGDADSSSLKLDYHPTTPGHKYIDLLTLNGLSAVTTGGDDDGDGVPDLVARMASDTAAGMTLDSDDDDDGVPENSVHALASPGQCSVAIKTKGTGADKNRVVSSTNDTSAVIRCDGDLDDDGIPDLLLVGGVIPGGTILSSRCSGIGSQGSENGTLDICTADSVRRYIDCDSDGDGVPEAELDQRLMPGTCSMAIKTKGTGADKNRVITVVSSDSTRHYLDMDSDGDGVPEQEIDQLLMPGTCSVAIKTKGTGADRNRVVSTSNDSSAIVQCDTDLDGDGIPELYLVGGALPGGSVLQSRASTLAPSGPSSGMQMVCTADSTRRYIDTDSDGDNIPDSEIEDRCLPTTCSVAIKTKGTGADRNRVVVTTTPDSVVTETTFEFTDALLLPALMKAKEKANKTKCSNTLRRESSSSNVDLECSVDSASSRVSLGCDDFSGTISSLTLQSSVGGTLDPIVHSSGALLTSGGTWTNASDANLKENFTAVDGEELLAKIEQLLITEWNYKVEGQSIKHIGPTAQDFSSVFGLGVNDKTISTIDPSGIALAAIKELARQNRELAASNDELRNELAEIKKLLEGLKK